MAKDLSIESSSRGMNQTNKNLTKYLNSKYNNNNLEHMQYLSSGANGQKNISGGSRVGGNILSSLKKRGVIKSFKEPYSFD